MTTTASQPAVERFAASNDVADRFFRAYAEAVASACHDMAKRFQRGGRLFVCGDGAQRSDVAHVVVEFMHPVVVGKRALPAIALPDIGSGAAQRALETMARSSDLLLMLLAQSRSGAVDALLADARSRGLLTLVLSGTVHESRPLVDILFVVPSADAFIIQETHEMLCHVLWELVHVFFDHRPVSA